METSSEGRLMVHRFSATPLARLAAACPRESPFGWLLRLRDVYIISHHGIPSTSRWSTRTPLGALSSTLLRTTCMRIFVGGASLGSACGCGQLVRRALNSAIGHLEWEQTSTRCRLLLSASLAARDPSGAVSLEDS